MTSIGFTGTRKGMTIAQWQQVYDLIVLLLQPDGAHEWHDGDAIGADAQAHGTVAKFAEKGAPVVLHGHPCNLPAQRAWMDYDCLHDVGKPLDRNRDIVNATDVLLAAPFEYEEQHRGSGTWATIRWARHVGRRLIIVWPDGSTSTEGGHP